MKNALILCTGNSCRSRLAEGLLRHLARDLFTVHAAFGAVRDEISHPLTAYLDGYRENLS